MYIDVLEMWRRVGGNWGLNNTMFENLGKNNKILGEGDLKLIQ